MPSNQTLKQYAIEVEVNTKKALDELDKLQTKVDKGINSGIINKNLQATVDELKKEIHDLSDSVSKDTETIKNKLSNSLSGIDTNKLKTKLKDVNNSINDVKEKIENLSNSFNKDSFIKFEKFIETLSAPLGELNKTVSSLNTTLTSLIKPLETISSIKLGSNEIKDFGMAFKALSPITKKASKQIIGSLEELNNVLTNTKILDPKKGLIQGFNDVEKESATRIKQMYSTIMSDVKLLSKQYSFNFNDLLSEAGFAIDESALKSIADRLTNIVNEALPQKERKSKETNLTTNVKLTANIDDDEVDKLVNNLKDTIETKVQSKLTDKVAIKVPIKGDTTGIRREIEDVIKTYNKETAGNENLQVAVPIRTILDEESLNIIRSRLQTELDKTGITIGGSATINGIEGISSDVSAIRSILTNGIPINSIGSTSGQLSLHANDVILDSKGNPVKSKDFEWLFNHQLKTSNELKTRSAFEAKYNLNRELEKGLNGIINGISRFLLGKSDKNPLDILKDNILYKTTTAKDDNYAKYGNGKTIQEQQSYLEEVVKNTTEAIGNEIIEIKNRFEQYKKQLTPGSKQIALNEIQAQLKDATNTRNINRFLGNKDNVKLIENYRKEQQQRNEEEIRALQERQVYLKEQAELEKNILKKNEDLVEIERLKAAIREDDARIKKLDPQKSHGLIRLLKETNIDRRNAINSSLEKIPEKILAEYNKVSGSMYALEQNKDRIEVLKNIKSYSAEEIAEQIISKPFSEAIKIVEGSSKLTQRIKEFLDQAMQRAIEDSVKSSIKESELYSNKSHAHQSWKAAQENISSTGNNVLGKTLEEQLHLVSNGKGISFKSKLDTASFKELSSIFSRTLDFGTGINKAGEIIRSMADEKDQASAVYLFIRKINEDSAETLATWEKQRDVLERIKELQEDKTKDNTSKINELMNNDYTKKLMVYEKDGKLITRSVDEAFGQLDTILKMISRQANEAKKGIATQVYSEIGSQKKYETNKEEYLREVSELKRLSSYGVENLTKPEAAHYNYYKDHVKVLREEISIYEDINNIQDRLVATAEKRVFEENKIKDSISNETEYGKYGFSKEGKSAYDATLQMSGATPDSLRNQYSKLSIEELTVAEEKHDLVIKELSSTLENYKDIEQAASDEAKRQTQERIASLQAEKKSIQDFIKEKTERDAKNGIIYNATSKNNDIKAIDEAIEHLKSGTAEVNKELQEKRNELEKITTEISAFESEKMSSIFGIKNPEEAQNVLSLYERIIEASNNYNEAKKKFSYNNFIDSIGGAGVSETNYRETLQYLDDSKTKLEELYKEVQKFVKDTGNTKLLKAFGQLDSEGRLGFSDELSKYMEMLSKRNSLQRGVNYLSKIYEDGNGDPLSYEAGAKNKIIATMTAEKELAESVLNTTIQQKNIIAEIRTEKEKELQTNEQILSTNVKAEKSEENKYYKEHSKELNQQLQEEKKNQTALNREFDNIIKKHSKSISQAEEELKIKQEELKTAQNLAKQKEKELQAEAQQQSLKYLKTGRNAGAVNKASRRRENELQSYNEQINLIQKQVDEAKTRLETEKQIEKYELDKSGINERLELSQKNIIALEQQKRLFEENHRLRLEELDAIKEQQNALKSSEKSENTNEQNAERSKRLTGIIANAKKKAAEDIVAAEQSELNLDEQIEALQKRIEKATEKEKRELENSLEILKQKHVESLNLAEAQEKQAENAKKTVFAQKQEQDREERKALKTGTITGKNGVITGNIALGDIATETTLRQILSVLTGGKASISGAIGEKFKDSVAFSDDYKALRKQFIDSKDINVLREMFTKFPTEAYSQYRLKENKKGELGYISANGSKVNEEIIAFTIKKMAEWGVTAEQLQQAINGVNEASKKESSSIQKEIEVKNEESTAVDNASKSTSKKTEAEKEAVEAEKERIKTLDDEVKKINSKKGVSDRNALFKELFTTNPELFDKYAFHGNIKEGYKAYSKSGKQNYLANQAEYDAETKAIRDSWTATFEELFKSIAKPAEKYSSDFKKALNSLLKSDITAKQKQQIVRAGASNGWVLGKGQKGGEYFKDPRFNQITEEDINLTNKYLTAKNKFNSSILETARAEGEAVKAGRTKVKVLTEEEQKEQELRQAENNRLKTLQQQVDKINSYKTVSAKNKNFQKLSEENSDFFDLYALHGNAQDGYKAVSKTGKRGYLAHKEEYDAETEAIRKTWQVAVEASNAIQQAEAAEGKAAEQSAAQVVQAEDRKQTAKKKTKGITAEQALASTDIAKINPQKAIDEEEWIWANAEASLLIYGKEAAQKYISGLKAETPEEEEAFKDFALVGVDAMKSVLGISSPSKVFEELGRYCGEGFKIGLSESFEDVKKQIINALQKSKLTKEELKELINWDGKDENGKAIFDMRKTKPGGDAEQLQNLKKAVTEIYNSDAIKETTKEQERYNRSIEYTNNQVDKYQRKLNDLRDKQSEAHIFDSEKIGTLPREIQTRLSNYLNTPNWGVKQTRRFEGLLKEYENAINSEIKAQQDAAKEAETQAKLDKSFNDKKIRHEGEMDKIRLQIEAENKKEADTQAKLVAKNEEILAKLTDTLDYKKSRNADFLNSLSTTNPKAFTHLGVLEASATTAINNAKGKAYNNTDYQNASKAVRAYIDALNDAYKEETKNASVIKNTNEQLDARIRKINEIYDKAQRKGVNSKNLFDSKTDLLNKVDSYKGINVSKDQFGALDSQIAQLREKATDAIRDVRKETKASADDINILLKQQEDAYKGIWNTKYKISKLDPDKDSIKVTQLEKELKDYQSIFIEKDKALKSSDADYNLQQRLNELIQIRADILRKINEAEAQAQQDKFSKIFSLDDKMSDSGFQSDKINLFMQKLNELKIRKDDILSNWGTGKYTDNDIEKLTADYSNLYAAANKYKETIGKMSFVDINAGDIDTIEKLKTSMFEYAKSQNYSNVVAKPYTDNQKQLTIVAKDTTGQMIELTGAINDTNKAMYVGQPVVKQSTSFWSAYGSTLKQAFSTFGYYLGFAALLRKTMREFRNGIQTLKTFDSALTTISYTMDLSQKELKELGNSAVDMAEDLSMSMENALKVYQIYANMQTTAKEIEEVSRPTAILSNLSGVDASTAADQVQGVLEQFNMLKEGEEDLAETSMHIVDVFDKISANVKIDYAKGISTISEAVTAAGQVAHDAGMSFEELAAITAKVAERTREDGSTIGNAMKTMLVRISKVSKMPQYADEVDNETLSKASKALHDIGIEVYNTNGEFNNITDTLTQLNEKWSSLTDVQKSDIAYQVAATRQSAKFKSMLEAWTDAMNLANEATKANGNALANQEKYEESYSGKLQRLQTEWQEFWMNLLNSEGFKKLLDVLTELISKINDFADSTSNAGLVIAGLGLASIVATLSKMGKQWLLNATGIKALGDAAASSATEFAALTASVDAATAALEANLAARTGNAAASTITKAEAGAMVSKALLQASGPGAAMDAATYASLKFGHSLEELQMIEKGTAVSSTAMAGAVKSSEGAMLGTATAASSIVPIIIGIIGAVALLTAAWEKANVTVKEVQDQINKTSSTISDIKGEIEQLQEVEDRTQAEEQRLSLLREELSLHEKILEKRKELLKREQVGTKFTDRFDSDNYATQIGFETGEIIEGDNIFSNIAGQVLTGLKSLFKTSTQEAVMEDMISAQQKYRDLLAELKTGDLNPAQKLFREEELREASEEYAQAIKDAELKILELKEKISEMDENGVDKNSKPYKQAVESLEEYKAALKDAQKEMNMYDFYESDEFGEAINNDIDKLKELINTEKDDSRLKKQIESNYPELISLMKQEGISIDNLINKYKELANEKENALVNNTVDYSKSEMIDAITSMTTGFDKLDEIYADVYNKGSFDFTKLASKGFTEAFEGLEEEYTEFIETVSANPSDLKASQAAFDKLASAYIDNSKALEGLTEENKQVAIDMLKNMGIANAEAVVTDRLATKQEMLAAEKAYAAKYSKELYNATVEEIDGLAKEEGYSEKAANALKALALEKMAVNGSVLDFSADLDSIVNFIDGIGGAVTALQTLQRIKRGETVALSQKGYSGSISWDLYKSNIEKQAQAEYDAAVKKLKDASNAKITPIQYSGADKTRDAIDKANKSAEESKEIIDWIEKALQRMEEEINRIDKTVSATYKNWSDRNNAIKSEISAITKEISMQQQAYEAYLRDAAAIPLAEEYKKLVREGAMYAETITDKNLKKLIDEYTELYDKAIKAQDAIIDLNAKIAALAKQKFDNVKSEFEGFTSEIEHFVKMIDRELSHVETMGKIAGKSFYQEKIDKNEEELEKLKEEREALVDALEEAEANGIEKGSADWIAMRNDIYAVDEEIQNLTYDIEELKQKIIQVDVLKFDNLKEQFDGVLSGIQHFRNMVDKMITHVENMGGIAGKSFYQAEIDQNNERLDALKVERQKLMKQLKEAEEDGLEKGSPDWLKMRDAIYEIDEQIVDTKYETEELKKKMKEVAMLDFDDLKAQFEQITSIIQNQVDVTNSVISLIDKSGHIASTKYYKNLIKMNKQTISTLRKEYETLQKKLAKAMENGDVKKYSDEWYKMTDSIDEVKKKILETAEATVEYANAIRQIKWDMFDRGLSDVTKLAEEQDFLAEQLREKAFDKDTGKITDSGMAAQALYVSNYEIYKKEAHGYAKEIEKIKKELEADPKNVTLIDRYNELLAAQREAVQNTEEQKKKIKELYKEGYDKLISSIQKLIDEYKEASNAAKELHDYQETIADKTSAVNKIQKQILAYSNGDTEENRATLQKLNEDLKKAQKDLANTEREKEKKDQEQLLDKFLRDLQEYADEQLLDVDKLLKEAIKTTNNNKEAITKTIGDKVNDLELSTSTNFETLWEKFSSTDLILTSTKDTVNKIREKANKLPTQDWQKGELEHLFGNDSNFIRKLGSIKNNTIRTKDKITDTKKAINNVKSKVVEFKKKNKEQLKEIDDGIDDVEKIEAKVEEYTGKEIPGKIDSVVDAIESKDLSVVVNVDAGGGYDVDPGGGDNPGGDNPGGDNPPKPENKKYYHISNTDLKFENGQDAEAKRQALAQGEATNRKNQLPAAMPEVDKRKAYQQYLKEALEKYKVEYYKRGGIVGGGSSFLDAIAQLLGEDHMIAAKEGERVLTEKQNKNFEKMVNENFTPLGNNPLAIDKLISDMAQVSTPNVGTMNNVGNTTTVGDVNITLPNVTNKQEFVSWLKNDGQIEKIIQSMTVGRIAGGNSFAKMKY